MAHFAELDSNNVVLRVIVIDNSEVDSNGGDKSTQAEEYVKSLVPLEGDGQVWKQTSFKKINFNNNSNTASSGSSSSGTGDKIAQSKKICKELGFKANSEKFADCALKMMAMQFETGNKVSNNDGSSTQKIIVQQQDDFDIGDFFFGLQKIVDDNYRSTNNSSNQGTNCRIVPKAWGADMVCR